MTLEEMQNLAYTRYQLLWMYTNGHSLKDLFRQVFYHYTENLDPDSGNFEEEDVLLINPDDLFDKWEKTGGFDDSTWVNKETFLSEKFQSGAYMAILLRPEEYKTYKQLREAQTCPES